MIMTRDDVVCIIDSSEIEEGLVPIDFLVHKDGIGSPWMSNYEFDEDRGTIRLSAYFDRMGTNILPLHHNLLGDIPELTVIDTIHGVFEGCQVEWMEYICHKPIDPYVICEIRPRELIPWSGGLPFQAYNIDPDFFGIHDGGRGGRPLPSMHHGQVCIEGVSIFGGDGLNQPRALTTLGDKTISISVKMMRNGDISAKQIITLKGRLWPNQDPADPKILEIMKGRIGFGEKPGRVPGNIGWMFYMIEENDDDDDDVDDSGEVKFQWGEDISINMTSSKMKAVTYVEDGFDFHPVANEADPDEDPTFSYRLYYGGRIVAE